MSSGEKRLFCMTTLTSPVEGAPVAGVVAAGGAAGAVEAFLSSPPQPATKAPARARAPHVIAMVVGRDMTPPEGSGRQWRCEISPPGRGPVPAARRAAGRDRTAGRA